MEGDSVIQADVCIVGSGPAGLGVASELAGESARVVVLEGGGERREPESQALYELESVGHPWGEGGIERRVRVLGGTSTVWTGRCAPFDPIDFRPRPWIPNSGWPLSRRDLDPYLARAGVLLGLGPHRYDEGMWERFGVSPPRPPLDPALLRTQLWQYSQTPDGRYVDFARDVLPGLLEAPNVTVVLHANVTRVTTRAGARAASGVEARSLGGQSLRVRAPIVVLACGAIENARLLLASNDGRPGGLGNDHDLVGRYLTDHPSPVIGTFEPAQAGPLLERFGHYWLDDERGRHVYYAGLGLSERVQMERGLPNATAYLLSEPRQDAAVLALRRLGEAVRGIPDARTFLRDALSVARDPAELARAAVRRTRHRPEIVPVHGLQLLCNPEQIPHRDSRVTLSERRDALGVPRVRVDWRVDPLEREAALAMLELVQRELPRVGLPAPRVPAWARGEEDWRPHFGDVAHPMGTTRMAADPSRGVVDSSCAVHGVGGLYVAGGSVFPTAGTANPTLMICALALRLGEHLRERLAARRPPPIHAASATRRRAASERVRVGIVGAGRRARGTYLPVLGALADRFEVAGMAARTRRERRANGVPVFDSVERMVERARPDLLVACVTPEANASVTDALLDFRVPLLVETPLAWSLRDGRTLLRRIRQLGVPVGVAEQMPFLPLEELKAALREAGVFGRVLAAHNDRHTFGYHAIAKLRRYLGPDRVAREASATSGACALSSSDGDAQGVASWQTGSVRYDDGAMLHHQLGVGAAPALTRIPGSLRIHGERASMVDDELRVDGHPPVRATRHQVRRGNGTVLRALSLAVPGVGEVRWDSPLGDTPLDDEQIAVAAHLEAMRHAVLGDGAPLYGAAEALRDVEILRAMQISASLSGAPVALPVRLSLEGVRLAARPRVWLDQLREARAGR
jgi:choline dehydrogenase-like flavoprotein/predicted dehydrogenase